MSESGTLIRYVTIIAIVAVFAVSLHSWEPGSPEIPGWSAFQSAMSADPFASLPAAPSFPSGAAQTAAPTTLYLRPASGPDCPSGSGAHLLDVNTESPETTQNLAAGTIYWNVFPAGVYTSGDFSVTLWITTGAGAPPVPRVTVSLKLLNLDCSTAVTLINAVQSTDLPVSSTFAYIWNATTTGSASGAILQVSAVRSQGAQTVVAVMGPVQASRVDTPTHVVSSGSACGWSDPVSCLVGPFNAFVNTIAFIVNVFVYAITGLVDIIIWFGTLVVTFFGALIGFGGYMVTGAGAPAPVSYFFVAIFVPMLAFIVLLIINTVRGRGES